MMKLYLINLIIIKVFILYKGIYSSIRQLVDYLSPYPETARVDRNVKHIKQYIHLI